MISVSFTSPAAARESAHQIIRHLRDGGLIAYPTETVYGFGCLVRDDAVTALAALKSRESAKPFLLLILEPGDVAGLEWTPSATRLAERFWPGALTLAIPVQGEFPSRILSSEGAVAVRATPHESLRTLLGLLGEPITSTSANLPGQPSATSAEQVSAVLADLGRSDVLVLDGGQLPPSAPSTVVDCSREPPRLIREGAITAEALMQVVELEINE